MDPAEVAKAGLMAKWLAAINDFDGEPIGVIL